MKFYIKTFGCQMNVHDSQRITSILEKNGHQPVESADDAEMILVNSCSVREKPWHKAISETGRARKAKKQGNKPNLLVGLVGCVAQQEGKHIFDLLDGVDFVVSPDNYMALPGIIDSVASNARTEALTGFDKGLDDDFLAPLDDNVSDVSAFVTIMKGCDEWCRYCIVPSVRGPERHRNPDKIEDEVRKLVSNGVREVTLLGQKVNAFDFQGTHLADLLIRLDAIGGLERIRFTSPHPRHMTKDLTDLYGQLPSLCEAIHLPVQAGSDAILSRMRRRYTRVEYLEVVARLRERMPNMAITTDIIVGYPGETEADFKETLSMIEEANYCAAFSFKYSPRPGTYAAKLDDDVSDQEKSERLQRIHAIVASQEASFRRSMLGTTHEVLVDARGRKPAQLSGRTRNFQIVNFVCDEPFEKMRGQLLKVKVSTVHPNSLEGELL